MYLYHNFFNQTICCSRVKPLLDQISEEFWNSLFLFLVILTVLGHSSQYFVECPSVWVFLMKTSESSWLDWVCGLEITDIPLSPCYFQSVILTSFLLMLENTLENQLKKKKVLFCSPLCRFQLCCFWAFMVGACKKETHLHKLNGPIHGQNATETKD